MKKHFDIIIVGAGPAGASCANTLKRGGADVLVIERKTIPRRKTCGGFLTKRAQTFIERRFSDIPPSLICSNSHASMRVSRTGKSFVDLPDTTMLNTYRAELDEWLVKQSEAPYIDGCRVKEVTRNNDGTTTLRVRRGDETETFTCRHLVGADGGNSTVRKCIDPAYRTNNLIYGHQEIYRTEYTEDKDHIYYLTGKKFSPYLSWFFWEDDCIYIGTSFYPKKKQFDYFGTILEKATTFYGLSDLTLVRKEGCFVDVRFQGHTLNFGKDNILLVGEAAGLLTAVSEGITSALFSGHHAATAILAGTDALERYRTLVKDEIAFVTDTWRRMR